MRERDIQLANEIGRRLSEYSENIRKLPGIEPNENKETLIAQLVDSVRRIRFIDAIKRRQLSPLRLDAQSGIFDPLRAAIIHYESGRIDEASWLVFLAIHFGKHSKDKWCLVKVFYSALGQGGTWDWKRATFNPDAMVQWLEDNYQAIAALNHRFGNHRKYESMNPRARNFTGLVLKSYVIWVQENGGHEELFAKIVRESKGDKKEAFSRLYKSMNKVLRFGRMGKFDYLTMLSKIGIVDIEPKSTYMTGATGPYSGANLLFTGQAESDLSRPKLDAWLIELDQHLDVGMQVIEDAICNWQKSPGMYKQFR